MNRETALRRVKLLTLLIFGASLPAAGQNIYKLPAGTHLRVKVDVELSSKVASVNDTFLATVSEPVKVNDSVVLPTGSVVEGRVIGVSPAGGFGRGGSLKIVFEHLNAFGGTRVIDGALAGEIAGPRPCFLLAAFMKGGEARLKKDEVVEIELKREVTLPVTAY
jgi:hypothetical protein